MSRSPDPAPRGPQLDGADLLPLLVAAATLVLIAFVMPAAATLAGSGRLPASRPGELIAGTIRLAAEQRFVDPASAYDTSTARQMPEAELWWLAAGGALLGLLAITGLTWRRLEPAMARERLGRRPYDPRGSRPRAWARPRDLRELTSRRKTRGGFSLGTIDRRKLRSDPEAHVALIAPTRAGKTTRFVIPWLLEHDGPAIVTSTKRDVLDVTRRWRSHLGQVWVYDPFNQDTCTWDPLDACTDWSTALRQATWLADATQQGDSEIASYWRGEAAKLLAPLLHAAAIDERPISAVLGWLDTQEIEEPGELLAGAHAVAAIKQLHGTASLDDRNRGTTYMSAGSVLAAYRYPELNRTNESCLTTSAFLDGRANTLYLVAADRHQQLLTPLIATALSALLHESAERAAGSQRCRRRSACSWTKQRTSRRYVNFPATSRKPPDTASASRPFGRPSPSSKSATARPRRPSSPTARPRSSWGRSPTSRRNACCATASTGRQPGRAGASNHGSSTPSARHGSSSVTERSSSRAAARPSSSRRARGGKRRRFADAPRERPAEGTSDSDPREATAGSGGRHPRAPTDRTGRFPQAV